MTTLRRHIENLDPPVWAALTRRAAEYAVAAAEHLDTAPPARVVALAGLPEAELTHRREQAGDPAPHRPTAQMRIVDAEHRQVMAEHRARDAEQDRADATAAAAAARAEALAATEAAESARALARAAEAEAVRKEAQRATERQQAQAVVERLRKQLEQVRVDAKAQVTVAEERTRAATERAEQRISERIAERAVGQRALDSVQARLERVRADAEARVSAAEEQVRAASERAEQRIAERAAERAAGQRALDEMQEQLDQAHADAETAAATAAAQTRAVQAQLDKLLAERAAAGQVLALPIPAVDLRPATRRIENMLTAMQQIDYTLEMAAAGQPSDAPPVPTLVGVVRERADGLAEELSTLPTLFGGESAIAARGYAQAAAVACCGLLQRISAAAQRLQTTGAAGETLPAVIGMLTDSQVQGMFERLTTRFQVYS